MKIIVQGLNIHYQVAGNKVAGKGQPLLILHGWNSSSQAWLKVQKNLAQKGFQVFIPDLPGFGNSEEPKTVWDLDHYCNFVLNFASVLGLEKFILAGHSFGGRLAIKLASKVPQKIEKLILISAAGLPVRKNFRDYGAMFLAKILKPFSWLPGFDFARTIFYKKFLRKTDYLKAEGIMKEIFKKVIEENLESLLPEIKAKTLLIWGREDKITPLQDGLKMKEKIPQAEIEILEGIGHAPNLKDPQLLSQKIGDFLR